MPDPTFGNLRDYFLHLRRVVSQNGLTQQVYALRLISIASNRADIIIDRQKFVFPNGATLHGYENVIFANGEIRRLGYSYAYTHPDGFYFRYDKDPDRARLPAHPLTHLHARAEEPRFPTHETCLDELIPFIQAF
jgi:hypothetical protein